MSSKERVICALRHQESDRLPRYLNVSPFAIGKLAHELQLRDYESLLSYFQIDLELLEVSYSCPYRDGRDMFGICHDRTPDGKMQQRFHPFANIQDEDDVAYYEWPQPAWADIDSLKKRLAQARAAGRFTVAGSGGHLVRQTFNLIGRENFMRIASENPQLVNAIIWKLSEFFLEVDRSIFMRCLGMIDMSCDFMELARGNSLLVDMDTFREYFEGPVCELVNQAKSFGIKTMVYSPGSVNEIIPDFINCGYDAIAPLQYSAKDMETAALKNVYGDELALIGHISMDKISLSDHNTVDAIHQHVSDVCDIMKVNGGYIFGADGMIDDRLDPGNIIAMFEAADIYGTY